MTEKMECTDINNSSSTSPFCVEWTFTNATVATTTPINIISDDPMLQVTLVFILFSIVFWTIVELGSRFMNNKV